MSRDESMRKPGDARFRAVAVACAVLSGCLSGCKEPDPYQPRQPTVGGYGAPMAGANAAAGVGQAPLAGIGGVAGVAAPPTVGGQVGGFPVSGTGSVVAGIGAPPPIAGSGTVEPTPVPVGPLPAFDAGSDPNRNKVAAGQLCARLAAIDCAGEVHCCNNPGRTLAACQADIANACMTGLYLDQIAANPITGFDPPAAESAFTLLEQKASQCDPSVAAFGSSVEGLRGILKGTVAPAGNCTPAMAIPDAPSAAASLASCSSITTHACFFMTALGNWNCDAKGGDGSGCNTDNNCLDGLYCNVTVGIVGKCAARLPNGSACRGPNACSSLYCKGGHCVAADQQSAYCLKE